MEVLLTYKANNRGKGDPFLSLLPVGLGYINALSENGVIIQDCQPVQLQLAGCCTNYGLRPTRYPGVSQFTHNRFESLRLAKMAKEANPACFVVFGGPHATHRSREILSRYPAVDAVVLGEGEETFAELADSLASGTPLQEIKGLALRNNGAIVQTPARSPLADLDALPLPAAFFDNALGVDTCRQLEFIITSRGCPAFCKFLLIAPILGKGSPLSLTKVNC